MSAKSKDQYRKEINQDTEVAKLRVLFEDVKDKRANNASHKLSDILMSGYAMFSLKYSSLLDFEQQNHLEKMNLQTLFGIKKVCSDTQLRDVLDGVNPDLTCTRLARVQITI